MLVQLWINIAVHLLLVPFSRKRAGCDVLIDPLRTIIGEEAGLWDQTRASGTTCARARQGSLLLVRID